MIFNNSQCDNSRPYRVKNAIEMHQMITMLAFHSFSFLASCLSSPSSVRSLLDICLWFRYLWMYLLDNMIILHVFFVSSCTGTLSLNILVCCTVLCTARDKREQELRNNSHFHSVYFFSFAFRFLRNVVMNISERLQDRTDTAFKWMKKKKN